MNLIMSHTSTTITED